MSDSSLQLQVFPLWDSYWQSGVTADCLEFEDDEGLLALARDIPTQQRPDAHGFWSYQDSREYPEIRPGESTYVYVRDLKKLEVGSNSHPRNHALKAYINALPDDLMVVLYWRDRD
mgnify:CR=1 FL=1